MNQTPQDSYRAIPIDCKNLPSHRGLRIKERIQRYRAFLAFVWRSPLTDRGVLWVSYFGALIMFILHLVGCFEAVAMRT